MTEFHFSLQNIAAGQGIAIAVTGMSIVFVALALISLYIFLLPKALQMLAPLLPSEASHRWDDATAPPSATEEDETLLAALGFALYTKMKNQTQLS